MRNQIKNINDKIPQYLQSIKTNRGKTLRYMLLALIFIPTIYTAALYITFDAGIVDLYNNVDEIYSSDEVLLQTIHQGDPMRRIQVDLENIPQACQNALIAIEDETFRANIGIDLKGLIRGTIAEITDQPFGGSTITQQLVKNATQNFFNRSTLEKYDEIFYALKVNASYSKDQILKMYLNNVYFGNFNYGIEAASRQYFEKRATNLSIAECAYLAGLPQRPSIYNPFFDVEGGLEREKLVLQRMVDLGYLTWVEFEEALNTELIFGTDSYSIRAPHFTEFVSEHMSTYHEGVGDIDRGQLLRINTTYNDALHQELLSHSRQLIGNKNVIVAIIVLNSDGSIATMIGDIYFFDRDGGNRPNYATEHLDALCNEGAECNTSLLDVTLRYLNGITNTEHDLWFVEEIRDKDLNTLFSKSAENSELPVGTAPTYTEGIEIGAIDGRVVGVYVNSE